ncbi:MAG: energy-coupling factor transporter transmembrane protein EcfT [Acholeplasmataceae bacterium]|jgi:energy-coupling factor transport system permease protein|nr:energy-coupling factor transporter transmembrane protein EcfT [Acholeplasmataceae bacterium]
MNSITIGQYIPGKSWLHRLDPRIKILALVSLLIALFLIPIEAKAIPGFLQGVIPIKYFSLLILGIFTFLIIIMVITTQISLMRILKGLKPVLFLLTFTVILQILSVSSDTPGTNLLAPIPMTLSWSAIAAIIVIIVLYFTLKKYIKFKTLFFFLMIAGIFIVQYFMPWPNGLPLSYEVILNDLVLIRSVFLVLRIVMVIILTSLLTFTTMTTDLNRGIESLLKPLKLIKIPVGTFAMMLSLTLRYIPTLLEETQTVMKAQASRGVDFKESKFKDKIGQIVSLLIPIFIISFKRAEELANAMEARGYVIGEPRTQIDAYKIKFADFLGLFTTILIFVFVILFRVYFG